MIDSLVSIIVPVYNRFIHVDRAIRSILSQSYKNWEIIVIDDSSEELYLLPDEIKNYSQSIKLLRNKNNIGPGLSRQKGLEIASGQYVCFLDSDDFYSNDFLDASLKVHYRYPGIAATYTASKYISNDAVRLGSDDEYFEIMPTLFNKNRPWATCSLLWNRNYVSIWKSIRTNQDSLFEIDCSFVNNKIRYVPGVYCYIDKITGLNSDDLVKRVDSDVNRNIVAIYAYKNYHKYNVDLQTERFIVQSILCRIYFTSSRLVLHGKGHILYKNGLVLLNKHFFDGVKLMFISIIVCFPSSIFRKIVKELLNRHYLKMKHALSRISFDIYGVRS